MEDASRRAIQRVITAMRENLGDELTVEEMARTAMFSRFHFSRVFQRVTGITPGRFLAALRLQRAKQLLISTSLSVTEISHQVGYSSVGTFSSRFSSSVGVSPRTYRRLGGATTQVSTAEDDRLGEGKAPSTVHGDVCAPETEQDRPVFVGLFPEPVPRERPVSCAVLERPGPYTLENVPPGTWYVLAYAAADDEGRPDFRVLADGNAAAIGSYGPFAIRADTVRIRADVLLRAVYALDPPVMLALLDVRSLALPVAS
jgi:AraC family transcriptional regulator